jgi:hypothetical protein
VTTSEIFAACARRELTPQQAAEALYANDRAEREAHRPSWVPRWLWQIAWPLP